MGAKVSMERGGAIEGITYKRLKWSILLCKRVRIVSRAPRKGAGEKTEKRGQPRLLAGKKNVGSRKRKMY